jgi:hypothetical protein
MTKKELDLLVCSADDIINNLLDLIESIDRNVYSRAQEVADANNWLKWSNAECTTTECLEICFNLTRKQF